MIRVLRALAPSWRPHRRALVGGALLAVAGVACSLAQPWPLGWVVDGVLDPSAANAGSTTMLAVAVGVLVVLVLLNAVVDYWSTRLLSSTGLRIANDLRERVFAHLNRLSLAYHGRHRVGDLTARVTADVDRTQELLVQSLAVLAPNGLLLVGMFAVMLRVDPAFTLLALAVSPVLVVTTWRSTVRLKRASRSARKADGVVASAATESLGAVQLVQTFGLEDRQERAFADLAGTSLEAGLRSVRLQARLSPAVDLVSVMSTAVVLWFGAQRVLAGEMQLGVLLVFLAYLGSLYKPVKQLAKLGNTFSKGIASAERVIEVLNEQPTVADAPGARPAPRLRGDVRFDHVSFDHGRGLVLDEVSLHLPAGSTVALVGATGSGKSTLASLLPRLADPHGGAVLLDGVDLRDYTVGSVRAQVSMVLQDCVLLRGTLRENIACGRPGATDEEIGRAASLALVDEFASRLPLGLDTPIGDRGHDLSGGQRQRVAIARAILRDAPILVLDEPTSALDAASEQLLVQALANLPSGRTTLVIAHRLSTIRMADRIAVMERGRIVEQGTHEQLLAWNGRYRRLVQAQHVPARTISRQHLPSARVHARSSR